MPARKKDTGPDAPKSWQDLARVCGLGRDSVKAAMMSGELPGVVVGKKPRYIVPAEAFRAFCEGRWMPKPRPVLSQPAKPAPTFLHTRKEKESA